MARSSVDLLFPASYALAENPVWLGAHGLLAFVDIATGSLHRLDPSHPLQIRTLNLGEWLSAIAPTADGRVLAACSAGLVIVDLKTGAEQTLVALGKDMDGHRYNDGKGDRSGRFLVGTMTKTAPRMPTGILYSISGQDRRQLLDGLRTPNALCFSPDGTILYACDTAEGDIWAFDYNAETGSLSNRRTFAASTIGPGKPDGATVDADGCVWSARYNGSAVVRITPDGRLDRIVELPVSQITSCAFGGARLDTLFITTARQNLAPGALAQQPLAGSIFAIDPGIGGLSETPFAIPPVVKDAR